MLKPAISAVSSIWFTSFLFSNRKETWINIFPIGMRDSCSKAAPANGYSCLQLVSKVETMKFLFVLCLTGRVDLMGRNLTSWPECFGANTRIPTVLGRCLWGCLSPTELIWDFCVSHPCGWKHICPSLGIIGPGKISYSGERQSLWQLFRQNKNKKCM